MHAAIASHRGQQAVQHAWVFERVGEEVDQHLLPLLCCDQALVQGVYQVVRSLCVHTCMYCMNMRVSSVAHSTHNFVTYLCVRLLGPKKKCWHCHFKDHTCLLPQHGMPQQ